MYYIINKEQQIIASDEKFLKSCNVADITALNKALLLDQVVLDINHEPTGEKTLTLQNQEQTSQFTVHVVLLSSLIGSLSLISLESKPLDETNTIPTKEIDIENLIISKQLNHTPHIITDIQKELDTPQASSSVEENTIFVDVAEISTKIGVSEKDYHDFFNDYVSTALSLEKDLQNHSDHKQSKAIETLLHLMNVLHLDFLKPNILRIQNASTESTSMEVSSFYEVLSRVTLKEKNDTNILDKLQDKPSQEKIDLKLTHVDNIKKSTLDKTVERQDIFELDFDISPTQDNPDSHSLITSKDDKVELNLDKPKPNLQIPAEIVDLSKVTPINFDFSLSDASQELSLPDNLIKEFIFDFIDQTHVEIDSMLKAYQNADLKSIQKIAHLLKGVASNLRITTLSDALYKIQFCNDLQDFESLIKNFWGHFLSFKIHMNSLAQKDK